eukprot:154255_1
MTTKTFSTKMSHLNCTDHDHLSAQQIPPVYICICSQPLKRVNGTTLLYDGQGVCCDECEESIKEDNVFWHCNEEYTDAHQSGWDICDHCIHRFKAQCKIEDCLCFKQLYSIMMKYNSSTADLPDHNKDDNDIPKANVVSILNCYLHVLFEHTDDKQFEMISETFGRCDIKKCKIIRRNYRNRHKIQQRNELYSMNDDIPLVQALDKIHCLFFHSYDIGHKTSCKSIHQNTVDDNKEGEQLHNLLFDDTVIQITSNKQQDTSSDLIHEHGHETYHQQLDNPIITGNVYSFGYLFNYDETDRLNRNTLWLSQRYINIDKKYGSLKEEMLHYMLVDQFDNEYAKAQNHYALHHCKKSFDCDIFGIEHLLSVMIYCNYDYLQLTFNKTYRTETEKHCNFYHLAKLLKDTVNTFGTTIREGGVSKFYRGVSNKVNFPHIFDVNGGLGVHIYSPLSTSSSIAVAINFTDQNSGLIAEFGGDNLPQSLSKYFDCKWISDYPGEFECLFIQNENALNINNITFTRSGMQFSPIIEGLTIIDNLVGLYGRVSHDIAQEMASLIIGIIDHRLSLSLPQYRSPFSELISYAETMIHTFFDKRETICVNYSVFKDNSCFISKYFLYSDCDWICTPLIRTMFPNVTDIEVNDIIVSKMTVINILWDFCHDTSSKLERVAVVPAEDSSVSINEVIENYTSIFRSKCLWIFTDWIERSHFTVVKDNLYTFATDVLWSFGQLYLNDVNDSVANLIKILVDTKLGCHSSNGMHKLHEQFRKDCEGQKDLDIDWECISVNDSKYGKYLFDTFCCVKFDWIELDQLQILLPQLMELFIRNINLSTDAMDRLLLYLSKNKKRTMTITIMTSPDTECDLDCDAAISKYQEDFAKEQFEMEKDGQQCLRIYKGYDIKTNEYQL